MKCTYLPEFRFKFRMTHNDFDSRPFTVTVVDTSRIPGVISGTFWGSWGITL